MTRSSFDDKYFSLPESMRMVLDNYHTRNLTHEASTRTLKNGFPNGHPKLDLALELLNTISRSRIQTERAEPVAKYYTHMTTAERNSIVGAYRHLAHEFAAAGFPNDEWLCLKKAEWFLAHCKGVDAK